MMNLKGCLVPRIQVSLHEIAWKLFLLKKGLLKLLFVLEIWGLRGQHWAEVICAMKPVIVEQDVISSPLRLNRLSKPSITTIHWIQSFERLLETKSYTKGLTVTNGIALGIRIGLLGLNWKTRLTMELGCLKQSNLTSCNHSRNPLLESSIESNVKQSIQNEIKIGYSLRDREMEPIEESDWN